MPIKNKEYRMHRIIHEYGVDAALAEKEMEKTDRERLNYCRHYTHRTWGQSGNYYLTLDNSLFGSEQSAMMIIEALQKRIINKK